MNGLKKNAFGQKQEVTITDNCCSSQINIIDDYGAAADVKIIYYWLELLQEKDTLIISIYCIKKKCGQQQSNWKVQSIKEKTNVEKNKNVNLIYYWIMLNYS